MPKLSKRQKKINEKLTPGKVYSIENALTLLKDLASSKFEESVDIVIKLGLDPKKEVIRGRALLPSGTGRSNRTVAVFARGQQAEDAKAANVKYVGFEDLAEQVKEQGKLDVDVVLATTEAMRVVGTLGPILGPRNLMPNPKEGTVTDNITDAIDNVLKGVRFRLDKGGDIHCSIGTINMPVPDLQKNIESLISSLKKIKPATAKGAYLRRMTLSSTMGPGLSVDISPFLA